MKAERQDEDLGNTRVSCADRRAFHEKWTAGPAVGTERPTARVLHLAERPRAVNGATRAGHENGMWRNEAAQYVSAFNLTAQR